MTVFVDASAIVAIIAREPEASSFADRLNQEPDRLTSPIAVWEAIRGVQSARGLSLSEARAIVAAFTQEAGLRVVAVEEEDGELAIEAHSRFGKGVHPAGLNFGDCFAYACARRHEADILFKGEDFALTDLPDAMLT